MIHLNIQLNGARLLSSQPDEGIVSIEVTDQDNPPVIMLTDPKTDEVDSFFLTYKDGRWSVLAFSELSDHPD
jgi:hypothetical protein